MKKEAFRIHKKSEREDEKTREKPQGESSKTPELNVCGTNKLMRVEALGTVPGTQ